MNDDFKILLIEDNHADMRLIQEYLLEVTNQTYEVYTAEKLNTGLAILDEQSIDLILLDLSLPDSRGRESIETIAEKTPQIPLVILTGLDDEQVAIDAIRLGVQDYLVKSNVNSNLLSRTIRHAIERKQTEQALSESQRVFETLVGNLPGMVYQCLNDENWTMLFVSSGCYNLTGYSKEELTDSAKIPFKDVIFPDDQDKVWSTIQESIQRKKKYQIEYRIIAKSGETKWVWEQGEPIFSKQGQLLFLEGFILNITERKRAENELESSKIFFEQLYLQSAISTQLLDPEGWCIRINPKFTELFGIMPDEIEGKKYNIFQDTQLIENKLDHKIKKVFDEKITIRNQIQYKINELDSPQNDARSTRRWLNIIAYPILDSNDQIEYIIIQHNDITDRKKAEEALRLSEERFRSLYENVLTGLYRTTPSGQIVMANPALVKMLGYKSFEEMIKLNVTTLNHMKNPDRKEFMNLLNSDGEVQGFESYWKKKDGTPIHIRESAIAIRDENGNIAFLEGTIEDITVNKMAEEELRRQQTNVTAIIENTKNRIWSIDKQYRLIVANSEFYKRNREERKKSYFPGDSLLDLSLTTGTANKWKEYYDRALNGERFQIEASTEFSHKERIYEYSFNPIIKPNQDVEGVSIIGRDVTERVQAHQQVQRQIRDLEALYENGIKISLSLNETEIGDHLINTFSKHLNWDHVLISLTDEDEDEEHLNLISYSNKNLSSKEENKLLTHNLLANKKGISSKVFKDGKPLRTSNLHSTPDYIEVIPNVKSGMFMPLKIGTRVIGVISVESEKYDAFNADDERLLATLATQAAIAFENARLFQKTQIEIAERKQIEKELELERSLLAERVKERTAELVYANEELARANRLKDEFLSTMSHELRTPLNAILSLSESLIEEVYGDITPDQETTLQIINESGHDLLELINDILDLSKMEAGKSELDIITVDVNEICKSALRITKQQAYKKHIDVTFSLDTDVSSIQADGRRLKQILVNLLTNAIKFTPENGSVGLDVRYEENKKMIKFCIWDTGIGIAKEQIPNLFQPFVQLDSSLNRRHAGTGLGLALVKKLAKMHSGKVGVTSELNKGSQFFVILPASNPLYNMESLENLSLLSRNNAVQTDISPSPHPQTSSQILIAEDNYANFKAIKDYLHNQGYEIFRASNGKEAVSRTKEIQPDIILMDIQMPEFDGIEAIKKIRSNSNYAQTYIIALTALAMPGDRDRCIKAGADDYIAKPVNLKKLAETIKTVLKNKEAI